MSDEEALTKGVERDCVAQWLGRRPACCGGWRCFVGLRVGWRDAWSGFVFFSMRCEQSTETKKKHGLKFDHDNSNAHSQLWHIMMSINFVQVLGC